MPIRAQRPSRVHVLGVHVVDPLAVLLDHGQGVHAAPGHVAEVGGEPHRGGQAVEQDLVVLRRPEQRACGRVGVERRLQPGRLGPLGDVAGRSSVPGAGARPGRGGRGPASGTAPATPRRSWRPGRWRHRPTPAPGASRARPPSPRPGSAPPARGCWPPGPGAGARRSANWPSMMTSGSSPAKPARPTTSQIWSTLPW